MWLCGISSRLLVAAARNIHTVITIADKTVYHTCKTWSTTAYYSYIQGILCTTESGKSNQKLKT